jgi:flagellar biogenesis protein FliO
VVRIDAVASTMQAVILCPFCIALAFAKIALFAVWTGLFKIVKLFLFAVFLVSRMTVGMATTPVESELGARQASNQSRSIMYKAI